MTDDKCSDRGIQPTPALLSQNISQSVRNRIIDDFVKDFSAWDWMYFRRKMREAQIADLQELAKFNDLPLDTILLIAAHLNLEEVSICSLVSRQWKDIWLHPVVMRSLVHRQFPGALLCFDESIPPQSILSKLHHQNSQPNGEGWTASKITCNIGPNAASTPSRQGVVDRSPPSIPPGRQLRFVCTAGKVAWQTSPSFVVVDDLLAGTWHRVSFMSDRIRGFSSTLIGFSGELLVIGQEGNSHSSHEFNTLSHKLLVHHVTTNTQKSITLPNSLVRCFTSGQRIVFITHGPAAFVYTWGGTLTQLKLFVDGAEALPDRSIEYGKAVLFHPFQVQTIFLVSALHSNSSVVVTKYQDGQWISQQTISLYGTFRFWKGCKANEYGLHSICDYGAVAPDGKVSVLMYNVLSQTFLTLLVIKRSRGWQGSIENPGAMYECIWNSHLFNTSIGNDSLSDDSSHPFDLEATPCTTAPIASPTSPESRQAEMVTRRVWKDQFQWADSPDQFSGFPRVLYVGDDFIIMNHDGGYMVLSAHALRICLREKEWGQ